MKSIYIVDIQREAHLKPLEYLMIIINKMKDKFDSLRILLINNMQAIVEIFINNKYIYAGIQYFSQEANFRIYYVVLKQKREDINVWFIDTARITPYYNFRKPKIFRHDDTPLLLFDITILYNKLNKVIEHFHSTSSGSRSMPNYSIIDLIVLDDKTSDNDNLNLILAEKYTIKERLMRITYNMEYFDKIVYDQLRGICYEFKKGNKILFYLGIIKYSYDEKNMISFIYHTDINKFKDILKYYELIYKYLKNHRKSFHNEDLDQIIELSRIKDMEDINKIIDMEIKKYLNFNDNKKYIIFLGILNYYSAYISGGFILSKLLELTNVHDDNLFIFIKYQELNRFIDDLRKQNFSMILVKLIKIDIPEYAQIYCCIECILNGIKIYIFIVSKEFSYEQFFYGNQINSLNAWFIKVYLNNDNEKIVIKAIINKKRHIENYKFLEEQYNLFAKEFTKKCSYSEETTFLLNLIKYLIGNINYKKIKYEDIIEFFISVYPTINNNTYNYIIHDPVDIYIDILQKELDISIEDIYIILLNILLNLHVNEETSRTEEKYFNYIRNILLKIGGIYDILPALNFIDFMRKFNMTKKYTNAPVLINLHLADDVIYNDISDKKTCNSIIMEEEEEDENKDTTLATYLSNYNNLLFILPGNTKFCTTKSNLTQWITATRDETYFLPYRIFFHQINDIEKDYYVSIPTTIGNIYILCSYIYIILLSQTRVFQFVEVPNNIELKEIKKGISIGIVPIIVKCNRVENYNEIILSKIESIL